MSQRILVTGATSPVGGELVRFLVEVGSAVKAGTRRPDCVFSQQPPFDSDVNEVLAPLLDRARRLERLLELLDSDSTCSVEDAPVGIAVGRDSAAVAAAALTTTEHFGEAYPLTGLEALTRADITETTWRVSGRGVSSETCSDEEDAPRSACRVR